MSADHLAGPALDVRGHDKALSPFVCLVVVFILLALGFVPAAALADAPLRLGEHVFEDRRVTWWAGPQGCADLPRLDAQHSCRRLTPSRALVIAVGGGAQALDVLQAMPAHLPVDVVTLDRGAQTRLEPVWGDEARVDGGAEVQLCATLGDQGGGLTQHLFEACVQRVQPHVLHPTPRHRRPLRWHLHVDAQHVAGPSTWRAAIQTLKTYHLIDASTAVVVIDTLPNVWSPNTLTQLVDLPPAHYTIISARPSTHTPKAFITSLQNVALVTSPWQNDDLKRVLFQRYRTTTVATQPASIAHLTHTPQNAKMDAGRQKAKLSKMLWLWYSMGVVAMVIVWFGRQLWFGARPTQKM